MIDWFHLPPPSVLLGSWGAVCSHFPRLLRSTELGCGRVGGSGIAAAIRGRSPVQAMCSGGERGIGCELKVQVFGIQVFLSDFGRHATHLACCNGVPACFTSHSLNGTRLGQLRVTMSNPFVSRSASRPGRRRTTVRCRVRHGECARLWARTVTRFNDYRSNYYPCAKIPCIAPPPHPQPHSPSSHTPPHRPSIALL